MNLMNQYFVFLGYLPLPVAPEKIEYSVPNLNKTINLVDLGEVNISRGGGLKEISFEMLLPSFNYPFANYSFGSLSISQSIGYLEYLKQTGTIANFIVIRGRKGLPSWWTNIYVTLEDFNVIEDANNGTDVVVSVNLKEYREYSTKLAKVEKKDGKVIAKFDNTRTITGNISPYLGNYKKLLNEDGTVTETLEVKAGTTLYNEVKKITGSGSVEAVKTLKKINSTANSTIKNASSTVKNTTSTVKNVVTETTNVKIYNSQVFGKVTADELKQKSGYITSASPKLEIHAPIKKSVINSAVFGNVTNEELKEKSGYISAAKPVHTYFTSRNTLIDRFKERMYLLHGVEL